MTRAQQTKNSGMLGRHKGRWQDQKPSAQRARFERSFTSGLRELKQLQKERRAQPQQHAQRQPPVEAKPTGQAAGAPVQHPSYAMADATGDHPAFCSPVTPDTR
jgi:hypothetical protein